MLELPSLPHTFSPAAPSLWVSAEGYVNISIWSSPLHRRGIRNWAVNQRRFDAWHAGSERPGTAGAGEREGAVTCSRLTLTWQGRKERCPDCSCFFHLHGLWTSLARPLPRAVLLGSFLGVWAAVSSGNCLGMG